MRLPVTIEYAPESDPVMPRIFTPHARDVLTVVVPLLRISLFRMTSELPAVEISQSGLSWIVDRRIFEPSPGRTPSPFDGPIPRCTYATFFPPAKPAAPPLATFVVPTPTNRSPFFGEIAVDVL